MLKEIMIPVHPYYLDDALGLMPIYEGTLALGFLPEGGGTGQAILSKGNRSEREDLRRKWLRTMVLTLQGVEAEAQVTCTRRDLPGDGLTTNDSTQIPLQRDGEAVTSVCFEQSFYSDVDLEIVSGRALAVPLNALDDLLRRVWEERPGRVALSRAQLDAYIADPRALHAHTGLPTYFARYAVGYSALDPHAGREAGTRGETYHYLGFRYERGIYLTLVEPPGATSERQER